MSLSKTKKVTRDAKRVAESARYIMRINGDGDVKETVTNGNYRANILAVIGPAEIEGKIIDAVLLEIGLWRTRPYNKAKWKNNGRSHRFHQRRKIAFLTRKQLENVLPHIEILLVNHAVKHSSKWNEHYWPVYARRTYINARKRRTYVRNRASITQKGIRFSVSRHDREFTEVIIRSGVFSRRDAIRKAAGFAAICLREHVHGSSDDLESIWKKRGHNSIRTLADSMSGRDLYYCAAIRDYLAERSGKHADQRAELFKEVLLKFCFVSEENLDAARKTLNNGGPRFPNANIWIVQERRKADEFLVFEILPPIDMVELYNAHATGDIKKVERFSKRLQEHSPALSSIADAP